MTPERKNRLTTVLSKRQHDLTIVLENVFDPHNISAVMRNLSSDAISLHDLDLTQSVALVFGNEHAGVSDECRELADGNFIIPQVGIIQSLNISVACAVSVYEAFRQKNKEGHYSTPHLPESYKDQLMQSWDLLEGD